MQNVQVDVGKTVRIKWLRKKKNYDKSLNSYMFRYKLKKATITEVIKPGCIDKFAQDMGLKPEPQLVDSQTTYHIDLDGGQYYWTKDMFIFGKWKLKE